MSNKKISLSERDWIKFATFGYAGYSLHGRGAIVIDLLPLVSPTGEKADFKEYVALERFNGRDWATSETKAMVEMYDPDKEIVVVFRKLDGGLEIGQLSTNEGPTPKQAYTQFADQLSRDQKDHSQHGQ